MNEYWKWYFELDDEWWIVDSNQDTFEVTSYYITMQIISKRFWFIERLVKNDKIEWSEETAFVTFLEREINADKSDALVSLLAVKDNPIEYLCSILKE